MQTQSPRHVVSHSFSLQAFTVSKGDITWFCLFHVPGYGHDILKMIDENYQPSR